MFEIGQWVIWNNGIYQIANVFVHPDGIAYDLMNALSGYMELGVLRGIAPFRFKRMPTMSHEEYVEVGRKGGETSRNRGTLYRFTDEDRERAADRRWYGED